MSLHRCLLFVLLNGSCLFPDARGQTEWTAPARMGAAYLADTGTAAWLYQPAWLARDRWQACMQVEKPWQIPGLQSGLLGACGQVAGVGLGLQLRARRANGFTGHQLLVAAGLRLGERCRLGVELSRDQWKAGTYDPVTSIGWRLGLVCSIIPGSLTLQVLATRPDQWFRSSHLLSNPGSGMQAGLGWRATETLLLWAEWRQWSGLFPEWKSGMWYMPGKIRWEWGCSFRDWESWAGIQLPGEGWTVGLQARYHRWWGWISGAELQIFPKRS